MFGVFVGEVLTLPISIPIDQDGVVVLQPRAPLDAHRVPASMTITRLTPDTYDIRIERADGGGMVVPGGDTPLAT